MTVPAMIIARVSQPPVPSQPSSAIPPTIPPNTLPMNSNATAQYLAERTNQLLGPNPSSGSCGASGEPWPRSPPTQDLVRGGDRLGDVGLAVPEGEEERLERRRREIEAALEHPVEEAAEAGAVELLDVGEASRLREPEEERQHRADALHAARDAA